MAWCSDRRVAGGLDDLDYRCEQAKTEAIAVSDFVSLPGVERHAIDERAVGARQILQHNAPWVRARSENAMP